MKKQKKEETVYHNKVEEKNKNENDNTKEEYANEFDLFNSQLYLQAQQQKLLLDNNANSKKNKKKGNAA